MANQKLFLAADFVDFLEICNKHDLEYLVIGGYAVSIHGYPRTTKDLDICIHAIEENAHRMVKVMEEFGFDSLKISHKDFLNLNEVVQIGYPPLRIDILMNLDGLDFNLAYEQRKMIEYEHISIPFIGYQHLIEAKKLAGRPQDMADVHKLERRRKPKI